MNNLTQKLICDGGIDHRIKMNLSILGIGFWLFFVGAICLFDKTLSEIFIDRTGMFHERFFLFFYGSAFIICGFIAFCVTRIKNTIILLRSQSSNTMKKNILTFAIFITAVLLGTGLIILLIEADFGANMLPICLSCLSAVFVIALSIEIIKKGDKNQ